MSIQIQKELLENLKAGEQMHKAMHAKAQEMIELMQIVKADALKRSRQYHRMVKAGEEGRVKEVKALFAEMQTWRKYKIIL